MDMGELTKVRTTKTKAKKRGKRALDVVIDLAPYIVTVLPPAVLPPAVLPPAAVPPAAPAETPPAEESKRGGKESWTQHGGGALGPSSADVAQAHTMRDAGFKLSAIARQLGVSRSTIDNWLKRAPEVQAVEPRFDDEKAVFHLILDRDSLLYARRRGDCVLLAKCEWEFIEIHGSRQGKCPIFCPGVPRER
jgi:transcriptional regulator with XRE-family HTH domain